MKLDMPASPLTGITWSPEQLAVFDAIRSAERRNLLVEAVAGSGKTTTLVGACGHMQGTIAFCAYNKRIADEIKSRVKHLPLVTAGTFHSFGFQAVRAQNYKVRVEGAKLEMIQEEIKMPFGIVKAARFLCSLAKQSGIGAICPIDDQSAWLALAEHFDVADMSDSSLDNILDASLTLLKASNLLRDAIDFDDMIYLPLLEELPLKKYDWVLVDEAQDTNTVRRLLATSMLKRDGRIVAVGDRHQAIYGFTGADADALDLIGNTFNCQYLPLTVTYRCPQKVVEFARRYVSHITAAPSAPQGVVRTIPLKEFKKLRADSLGAGDAVLCRYTKPCVQGALGCIRQGIGARVEGRDIGQGMVNLTKKWKTANTLDDLCDRLIEYRDREVRKALEKHNEMAAAAVEDRVDTLFCIIESIPADSTLEELRRTILDLFGDTQPGEKARVVVFSTVHKAKGREWKRVYLLGRDKFMPSKYAVQPWQLEQENNLIYVAVTRAMEELVEVTYGEKEEEV